MQASSADIGEDDFDFDSFGFDEEDDESFQDPSSLLQNQNQPIPAVSFQSAKSILASHAEFDKQTAHVSNMNNANVLAYITPWNNHGYDIVKMFRGKFTHLAPVWYQLNPDRTRAGSYVLTGDHDVDVEWIKEVTEPVRVEGRDLFIPKMVPRFAIEGLAREDLEAIQGKEKVYEGLAELIVEECKLSLFSVVFFLIDVGIV
ncbi:Chitinase domain-containing protein 1 [Podochytrium sp. JEL0797]|nr:Chitinase domain-containing protein 1 [Podochytrium sp. JEL0797]